jgi:hypothetical protein
MTFIDKIASLLQNCENKKAMTMFLVGDEMRKIMDTGKYKYIKSAACEVSHDMCRLGFNKGPEYYYACHRIQSRFDSKQRKELLKFPLKESDVYALACMTKARCYKAVSGIYSGKHKRPYNLSTNLRSRHSIKPPPIATLKHDEVRLFDCGRFVREQFIRGLAACISKLMFMGIDQSRFMECLNQAIDMASRSSGKPWYTTITVRKEHAA